MGRIAMLGRFEYEYEYRDAESEYEKNREKSGAPKLPPVLSELLNRGFRRHR